MVLWDCLYGQSFKKIMTFSFLRFHTLHTFFLSFFPLIVPFRTCRISGVASHPVSFFIFNRKCFSYYFFENEFAEIWSINFKFYPEKFPSTTIASLLRGFFKTLSYCLVLLMSLPFIRMITHFFSFFYIGKCVMQLDYNYKHT